MAISSLEKAISNQREDMLRFLDELVSIDSGTHFRLGVARMAECISLRLRSSGYRVEEIPGHQGNPSLLVQGDKPRGRPVLLMGHMDTVWPEGETQRRPFRIEGDRAYGPGVHDMKSSLVAMVFAALIFRELHGHGDSLALLFNGEEEVGSPQSRHLIVAQAHSASVVFNLEPQLQPDSVVTRRDGYGHLTVTCRGRSAQAGSGWKRGANAIHALLEYLQRLRALTAGDVRTQVTLIEGGTVPNAIADSAQALVDVRFSSLAQWQEVQAYARTLVSTPIIPGTHGQACAQLQMPPLRRTEAVASAYQRLNHVAHTLGRELREMALGSEADGSWAQAAGAATLDGLGVYGGDAHHADEWTYLPSLFEQTRLLVSAMEEFAPAPPEARAERLG